MEFENNNGSQSPSSPNPRCSSHKRKAGRKKFRETRHPVYRGVRQRNGNKWVCEIREPKNKSRIWVGTYLTPEMAARAHDVAVLALSGTSAKFNFPESVSLLPLPNSSSAIDIRAAAAKATSADLTFSSSHNGNNAHQCPCFNFSMLGLEGIPDSNSNDESQTMFFDEEALYNMPALLDSMAEGLLLTPPSIKTPMDWDDLASQIDLTLWTN